MAEKRATEMCTICLNDFYLLHFLNRPKMQTLATRTIALMRAIYREIFL